MCYLCRVIKRSLKLLNMKVSELKRLLTAAGCFMEKQKTNHEWWVNPKNGQHFAIPRHQSEEVSKGLLSRIKKEAGLDD